MRARLRDELRGLWLEPRDPRLLQLGFSLLFLLDTCLRRHGLPRVPADLGLTNEQFTDAVAYAPRTRPDRYTILEHLDLPVPDLAARVSAYVDAYGR